MRIYYVYFVVSGNEKWLSKCVKKYSQTPASQEFVKKIFHLVRITRPFTSLLSGGLDPSLLAFHKDRFQIVHPFPVHIVTSFLMKSKFCWYEGLWYFVSINSWVFRLCWILLLMSNLNNSSCEQFFSSNKSIY